MALLTLTMFFANWLIEEAIEEESKCFHVSLTREIKSSSSNHRGLNLSGAEGDLILVFIRKIMGLWSKIPPSHTI
jgi:hypothetical protein